MVGGGVVKEQGENRHGGRRDKEPDTWLLVVYFVYCMQKEIISLHLGPCDNDDRLRQKVPYGAIDFLKQSGPF